MVLFPGTLLSAYPQIVYAGRRCPLSAGMRLERRSASAEPVVFSAIIIPLPRPVILPYTDIYGADGFDPLNFPHPFTAGGAMRKGVLAAMCGGALLFAAGAWKDGDRIQALVMIGITLGVMCLMLWVDAKDKNKDK